MTNEIDRPMPKEKKMKNPQVTRFQNENIELLKRIDILEKQIADLNKRLEAYRNYDATTKTFYNASLASINGQLDQVKNVISLLQFKGDGI